MRNIAAILAVFLIVGCANLTPQASVPTPQPSPSAANTAASTSTPGAQATPTVAATQTPAATQTAATTPTAGDPSAFFKSAQELLRTYVPPDSDPAPLYNALAQAVMEFLRAVANPDVTLEGQAALEELQGGLANLSHLDSQLKPSLAVIHIRNSEGGSEDLVLLSIQQLMGLPIIGIHRLGPSYQLIPASAFESEGGNNYFYSRDVIAQDVT